jgi:LuxR family transcriptional regulator, maltose regulon positive regulatory protein
MAALQLLADQAERTAERQPPVRRSALFKRLSTVGPGGVLLICAPAGSGKSLLMRAWTEASELHDRAAWISVERGERDAQRFLLSMMDALAGIDPAVERIAGAPEFQGELILARLVSELDSVEAPVVLVVDDLHELRSAEALMWLERLIARLPSTMLLVLVTREDPRLGLHRLRLTGELTELRAPDLRFSLEETRELLAAAGIRLSDAGVALLHERTEGWAAGLRLAAISLSRHDDPERFVREFSGSERTVAGYLVAEVLERQPAEVRELLLRTSVLERVSGPLADFLTGASGSERMLQELEDANAFVTSLDATRSWFRYHHLFADLLQLELRRTSPSMVGPLHRAAAQWHEQAGNVIEAIRHAEAAHDWRLASRLLADHSLDLTLDGRAGSLRQLLNAFPDDVATTDAEIALVFATVSLMEQEREKGAGYVELAQRLIDTVGQERSPRFNVLLGVLKLLIGRWRGDLRAVLAAIESTEAALAALPERALSDALKSSALQNLGVAELWSSRCDDALRHLEQALALARHAGRPWLEIPCLGHLGIAAPWTGLTFSEGLGFSGEAVRIADGNGWGEDPVIVTALATGAVALLWLGRFDEVERWLERAGRTLHPGGEPGTELVVYHARGVLCLARGQFDEALAAFASAERLQALLADKHPFALRTRARVLQTQARMGQLAAAKATIIGMSETERDTSAGRIGAASVYLAACDPERALDVLGPAVIEGSTSEMCPSPALTEAQVLDAAAREQLGDTRDAERSLERALELAEPQGIVLPFVLAPVGGLLERLPRYRTAHATLLRTILDVLAGSSRENRRETPPLLDELSEAELRVIRYLPSNLKAPEIAAELCVSANTVRTHIRHVYLKLSAHDRNEAVTRARELGLLAPSRRSR